MKKIFRRMAGSGLILLGISLIMGCESSDGGPSGNSTVTGNVVAFETAASIRPAGSLQSESWLARLAGALSDLMLTSARAETTPVTGGAGGITVSLDGPAERSATTADDGTFTLTDLPAGAYEVTFSRDGQVVRYRGKSGQVATIQVGENETVHLVNIRISGGHVNIGNVVTLRPKTDEADKD